jgi:hypothetical protein
LPKPSGWGWNRGKAASRAWLRCSPRHRPGMWPPAAVVMRAVMACRASVPVIGSWLIDRTPSRRRLAVEPIYRSACRLVSRFPVRKSVVSLMAVSVRVRSAVRSLWYCLIRCACSPHAGRA